MKEKAVLAVAVVAIFGVVVLANALPAAGGGESKASFSLQFVRSGGFAGTHDVLTIDSSGMASYSSRFGQSFNVSLSPAQISSLRNTLAGNLSAVSASSYDPKSGAADFFSYQLTFTEEGKTTQVSWVDEWASSAPFPVELRNVQQTLQVMIQSLS